MIARYSYSGLTWIDLETPTREEVDHVLEEFSLPATAGQEMLSDTLRSKADIYEKFLYVILHFPIDTAADDTKKDEQEVDFLLGKDFIITVRYNLLDPLHQFATIFEKRSATFGKKHLYHSGYMFAEMMKYFYHHALYDLELIGEKIKRIEQRIFEGKEEQLVREISRMSRKLLDFKQSIRFHGDILTSYEAASTRLFGAEYAYYASLIISDYNKVHTLLESHRDTLSELQRTNDSLLSTRSNEIMRTFTILTFVMMPLTIITGIFGMNTSTNIMFIKDRGDFLFIVGGMIVVALVMFAFFKLRKWL